MDNGLIFPYRRRTDPTEPGILTTRTTITAALRGVWVVWGAWDLIRGGKRVNRCDAGR